MSVIIISSDSDNVGLEIAQSTAESLGYNLVSGEILGSVAEKHQIPLEKLSQALNECPSFLAHL